VSDFRWDETWITLLCFGARPEE